MINKKNFISNHKNDIKLIKIHFAVKFDYLRPTHWNDAINVSYIGKGLYFKQNVDQNQNNQTLSMRIDFIAFSYPSF